MNLLESRKELLNPSSKDLYYNKYSFQMRRNISFKKIRRNLSSIAPLKGGIVFQK